MSTSEAQTDLEGLEALGTAVSRVLGRVRTLESELREARSQRDEMEALLQRMNTGEESPARMAERLEALTEENRDLRRRVNEGRAAAERLLARVRYLESQG